MSVPYTQGHRRAAYNIISYFPKVNHTLERESTWACLRQKLQSFIAYSWDCYTITHLIVYGSQRKPWCSEGGGPHEGATIRKHWGSSWRMATTIDLFFFWCVQLWELVKQSNKLAVFTCDANVWNFWAISLEENAAIKRERSRTGWNPQAHTETHVEGLKLICFSASDIGGGVTSAAQAFHHRAKHTLGPKTQRWKRFSGKVELLQT